MREVRDRLIEDARREGSRTPKDASTNSLERYALSNGNRDRTIQLLAESLDKVAVHVRTEDENVRLRRENEALRVELERMRPRSVRKGKS